MSSWKGCPTLAAPGSAEVSSPVLALQGFQSPVRVALGDVGSGGLGTAGGWLDWQSSEPKRKEFWCSLI